MKYLLNEEKLRLLRIADIQSEEREYEEFLQSLYEVHLLNNFTEQQLLNENFLSKVKDTFKSFTGKAKDSLKSAFSLIKKNGENPSEFVKKFGDIFQGVKFKNVTEMGNLIKLAKKTADSKSNVQELEGSAAPLVGYDPAPVQNYTGTPDMEIDNVNDLDKVGIEQDFKWTGKTTDYDDLIVTNYKSLPQGVFLKDEIYRKRLDTVNGIEFIENVKSLTKIDDSNEDYENKVRFVQKLGDFFRRNKWLTLGLGFLFSAGFTAANTGMGVAAISKALSDDNPNVKSVFAPQSGSDPDYAKNVDADQDRSIAGDASGDDVEDIKGKIDLGGDGIIDDKELDNFKTKLKQYISGETTDNIATAATFDVGEYELTAEQQDWVVKKGVDNVLNQIKDVISEKGVTNTITVDAESVGHISSNAGDQDNVANDGSDLAKGRAEYGKKIIELIKVKVNEVVKKTVGKNVNVEFNTSVDADSDVKDQKQHSAFNNSADQSTIIKIKGVKTDGGKVRTMLNWQPLRAGRIVYWWERITGKKDNKETGEETGGTDKKTGEETGGTDKDREKTDKETGGGTGTTKPIPVGDADPDEAEKLFKDKSLNRNQEILSVLKMANPNIKGDVNDKSYKSWDDNTKKIVIDLRKSPDVLLKKFQSVTGINVSPRQKSTKRFQRSGIAESILAEAAIDKKLEILSITDDAIRKNKVEIMAMLMKMYNLKPSDIPDEVKKLTPDEQKQLKSITGELDTMFKKFSDVERIKNDLNLSTQTQTALSRINTYDEFEALILGMAALVNPNLAKQKQDIKAALFNLANKVKKMQEESETPGDTEGVYKIIDTLKTLKNHLSAVNTRDEFEALIFALLPFIDPKGTITKDKNKLASAIIAASNRSSLKDPKPIDLDKLGR